MSAELTDLLRAVVEGARELRRDPTYPDAAPHPGRLFEVVDALEEFLTPNVPAGDEERKPWRQVPAGSFVLAPNGEWYEVTNTREVDEETQEVTLRVSGKEAPFPRDKHALVTFRYGSKYLELRDALVVLGETFGAFNIIQDGS